MEFSRRGVLAGASAFALASCGGGGDSPPPTSGGPSPGPTPTPSPTPTPTPTPTPGVSSPFRDTVADDYLRALVTDLRVDGGDPAVDYVLNYETAYFAGSNLYRVRLILRDASSGTDVAMWAAQADRDFTGEIPRTVLFTQRTLPSYTGITALGRIDWSQIDWTRTALTTYTSPDEAGIKTDRVLTRAEIHDRFAAAAEPAVTLTVGGGTADGTHFNSFADALRSLYRSGSPITRSTFPCSDIAAFSNQVLIECVDDGYVEEMPALRSGNIDEGILIPPFVTLRGRGDTRLFLPDTGGTAPVLEAPFSFRIEDMVLENRGRGYALHIDNANGLSRRDERNGARLNFPLVSVMKNVRFVGSPLQETWLQGCGLSNGHLMVMDGCVNEAVKPSNMFGIHNSPDTTDPGRIEIVNSTFNDADFSGAAAVQLVTSFAQATPHEVTVVGSKIGRITNGSTSGLASAFVLV